MMNTMVWIRDTIVWIVFVSLIMIGLAIWWIKNKLFIDFDALDWGPKPDPERFELHRIPKLKVRKVEQMDKPSFELLYENPNHLELMPSVIIRTTSLELATYLLHSIEQALKDNGYKNFTLYIKSMQGGLILGGNKRVGS